MTDQKADQVSYGRRLTMLAAQHADDDVAVVFAAEDGGEQPITWKELEDRSNQVAHFLADRGVGQDDVVVVAAPQLTRTSLLGVRRLEARRVGAAPALGPAGMERDRLLAVAREANGKVVVAGWENAAPGTVTPDDIEATRNLSTDPPEPDGIPPYTRLIATSGATGSPKIVVTPSPGVMAVDDQLTQVMQARRGRAVSHDVTAVPRERVRLRVQPALGEQPDRAHGAVRRRAAAVDLIERYHIAYTCMVPTMLMRVARLEDVQARDFSSIERIVYGGASIPEWVVRAWFELVPPERFAFTYGGSEGHGLVMTTGDQWLEHPGTVGKPLFGEAKILDEDGNELPTGEIGEIYLGAAVPAPASATSASPLPRAAASGFGSFGDMGYVDEDGFIYIADRRRDMIVTGGANVYPAEVEAVLTEHPGVLDVVVVGLPDPEWGHRVHAIVEARRIPRDPPTTDELREHSKARLSSYKVPKTYETVERIPRSAAGKVNRSALVEERASDVA